jgi:hypothetical protein
MRASILMTALATAAAACAVSPEVTPYPVDAQTGMIDAPGPVGDASGPRPDAGPMGGDAGGPGGDAGPGAGTVGWPEPFVGSRVLIPPDTMFAFKLPTIDVDGSLQAWGIVPTSGSDARIYMALYRDGEGQPADLMSWTEEWSAVEGEYPATGVPLQAGEYWLVVVTQTELELGDDPEQAIQLCLLAHSFGAPFDSFFGIPDCTTTNAPNVYIRLGATGP